MWMGSSIQKQLLNLLCIVYILIGTRNLSFLNGKVEFMETLTP